MTLREEHRFICTEYLQQYYVKLTNIRIVFSILIVLSGWLTKDWSAKSCLAKNEALETRFLKAG